MTLNLVTKLNKGTSRTEYGGLNYWGFKTPDGLIRARVSPPSDGNNANIEVRFYDLTKLSSWRKRLDWDQAVFISSSYMTVTDHEKGPDSKSMVDEVNALIEIYNDEFAKHIGRKVVRTEEYRARDQYNNNDDRLNPYEVTGVSVLFDNSMKMSTQLEVGTERYNRVRLLSTDVEDYADDAGKAAVLEQIEEYRTRANRSLVYLDSLEKAVEGGVEFSKPGFGDEELGLMDNYSISVVIDAANTLIPEPATI